MAGAEGEVTSVELNGGRVEIFRALDQPDECKVWLGERLVFYGQSLSAEHGPELIAKALALIEDLAAFGTRCDTTPSIGGVISRADDVAGWYRYLEMIDEGIKARAKAVLGRG